MILLCAAFCFGASARAQSTTPSAPTTSAVSVLSGEQVDSLLAQLSNDDFRVRHEAQERLISLGEDARQIIRELLSRTAQTDIRANLAVVLRQLDENLVLGPSIITLHANRASPREVFAELSRQCRADLRPAPENLWDIGTWPRLTLELDHQPFWPAMQQIAQQANFDVQTASDGLRIVRAPSRLRGPSVSHGPFLVVATQISRSQTIPLLPNTAARADFSAQLLVFVEPKIQVLDHSPTVELDEATDDQNNNLLPDPNDVGAYYAGGGRVWNLHAALHYPDHPGVKISTLRGTTWFLIQTASQHLEILDLLKARPTSRVVGGLPVQLSEMKKIGEMHELVISIARDPNDPRWAQLQRFIMQHLYVYDAAGELMPQRRMSSRSTSMQMEFTISFAVTAKPSGEPARLVWDIPTDARAITVPFEFKDLPMPR